MGDWFLREHISITPPSPRLCTPDCECVSLSFLHLTLSIFVSVSVSLSVLCSLSLSLFLSLSLSPSLSLSIPNYVRLIVSLFVCLSLSLFRSPSLSSLRHFPSTAPAVYSTAQFPRALAEAVRDLTLRELARCTPRDCDVALHLLSGMFVVMRDEIDACVVRWVCCGEDEDGVRMGMRMVWVVFGVVWCG